MRWLLKLYPPAWRRRYEAEMVALLDEERAGRRSIVDLIRGAADAWVIGPRGPLGGLGVWLAGVFYFVVSVALALWHRAIAPLGEPFEALYQALYWILFVFFITWLADQPAAKCDLGRLIRFVRRRA